MELKPHNNPPPPPPSLEYRFSFSGKQVETDKSIRRRRDYEMFMKGFLYAHGEPNIPQPGDYL